MALSLVGVLIVLAPDEGGRVFSFSEGHGPSAQDLVGIIVILIGWLAFLIPLYGSRSMIRGPGWLMSVALAGAGLLVWSVATDAGTWWVLGVVLLVGVQVVAAVSAIRKAPVSKQR
jgi:hypothetical protein